MLTGTPSMTKPHDLFRQVRLNGGKGEQEGMRGVFVCGVWTWVWEVGSPWLCPSGREGGDKQDHLAA
eukprot:74894-Chlamydomonas_euryale.AAC.1